MSENGNWKLEIEYDGADFHGWQRQTRDRSIQGEIEKALSTVLRSDILITGAGRTDAGVHARGQVANFSADAPFDQGRLRWQLNAILPPEIAIKAVGPVPRDFDARRSAIGRTYQYLMLNRPYKSAHWSRYSWWIARPFDRGQARLAAKSLLGTHDFSAYTVAKEGSFVREIQAIEIAEDPRAEGMIGITVAANAFLHHMVRLIVGTLAEVAVGKLPPEAVADILAAGDVRQAGPRAPAKGLTLQKIHY